jgi:sialic acid synthase
MPAYKVASGDIRNTPLLQYIAKIGKPMIISTGAATLEDVRRGYDACRKYNDQVAILQCTAGYPVKYEEMDLNVITTYRKLFPDTVIGLSAHDNGIAMSVAAYVLGSRIVEKHFTLNRAMKGTDHAFSLEPLGMEKMVRDLRRIRVALGSTEKRIHKSEEPALGKMGKKLVAARDLPPGWVIRPEDVAGVFSGEVFTGKNRVEVVWDVDGPPNPMDPSQKVKVNKVAAKYTGVNSPLSTEVPSEGKTDLKFEVTSK